MEYYSNFFWEKYLIIIRYKSMIYFVRLLKRIISRFYINYIENLNRKGKLDLIFFLMFITNYVK